MKVLVHKPSGVAVRYFPDEEVIVIDETSIILPMKNLVFSAYNSDNSIIYENIIVKNPIPYKFLFDGLSFKRNPLFTEPFSNRQAKKIT